MNNIELIDDYLTNKLSDAQREAFEQQVAADPTLQADVAFQRQVIESVKNARVAELKSMLNNVPIGAAKEFTTLKVAAGIVGGALLIGSIYWFGSGEDQPILAEPEDSISIVTESEPTPPSKEEELTNTSEQKTEAEAKPEAKVDSKATTTVKKDVIKPTIEVVDPSVELVESTSSPVNHGVVHATPPAIEIKSLEVNVDSTSKKYKFHYQFVEGKVVLYGAFDRSLYEIIELNGGNHSVYLFYQSKYYLLAEQATVITPLEVITDKATVTKLEAYRKK
jgi:hypothetical protein